MVPGRRPVRTGNAHDRVDALGVWVDDLDKRISALDGGLDKRISALDGGLYKRVGGFVADAVGAVRILRNDIVWLQIGWWALVIWLALVTAFVFGANPHDSKPLLITNTTSQAQRAVTAGEWYEELRH